jgi:hypothetical protein
VLGTVPIAGSAVWCVRDCRVSRALVRTSRAGGTGGTSRGTPMGVRIALGQGHNDKIPGLRANRRPPLPGLPHALRSTSGRATRVAKLIEGFESSFGMDLLATGS